MRNLQQSYDLVPSNAWKAFEKIIYGIPGLKMIKESSHWHACPDEHWRAAENFRIGVNDFPLPHALSLALESLLFKQLVSSV